MAHPDYQRVTGHITPEACRQTLSEMVDIASPTGREGDLARYCVGRLSTAGFMAYLQEVESGRPNAVAIRRGSGKGHSLLFTGHMDTSYDGDEEQYRGEGYKAKAVYRDGWIWGLGANNMKSGLAAAMVALEAIARENVALEGDLLYGAVVGETEKAPIEEFRGSNTSGYGIGSRYLVTHGVTADYAILCEPTALRVCTANMGVLWLKITVQGTISHSALTNRPGVVNAIAEMHALQSHLQHWIERVQAAPEYLGERPNVTIAAIRGGMPWRLSRNPYECSLYLDIRTVPGQSGEDVKRSLRAELRSFAKARGCEEPVLQAYVTDPPTALEADAPLTRFLKDSHRRVTGSESPLIMRRTGADSTHFNRYDVPCICYGPGGINHPDYKGALMHSVGEHASVDALVTAAKVYVDAALTMCGENG
jgi:acetylornithine deacetylase/succinyl-diaminopimelate desuccinylase-like protein